MIPKKGISLLFGAILGWSAPLLAETRGTIHLDQDGGNLPGEVWQAQSYNRVTDMALAGQTLWVGTNAGLLKYNLATKKWAVVLDSDKKFPAYIHQMIYAAPFLWISSNKGLHRLDPQTGEWVTWDAMDQLPAGEVISLAVSRDGSKSDYDLWFSYRNPFDLTQFSLYGKKIKHWKIPKGEDNPYLAYSYPSLFWDEGILWILNGNGLRSLDPHTGEFKKWDVNSSVEYSPAYYGSENTQWTADKKNIYLGTGLGSLGFLYKFDKNKKKWEKTVNSFSFPVAKKDGLLWVGASYDLTGASRFVLRHLKDYEKDWKNDFRYNGSQVITKIIPRGKDFWLGTYQGIVHWKPGSNFFTRYKMEAQAVKAQPNDPNARVFSFQFSKEKIALEKDPEGGSPSISDEWNTRPSIK